MDRWREWWSTARSSMVVHRRLKWFWIAQLPIVIPITMGWVPERLGIGYLALVSIYANAVGHWSGEDAIKSEVRAEEEG